jgi:hypothetical protein
MQAGLHETCHLHWDLKKMVQAFESWSLANDVSISRTPQQQDLCRLMKKQHAPAFHHFMGSCSRSNDVPIDCFRPQQRPWLFGGRPTLADVNLRSLLPRTLLLISTTVSYMINFYLPSSMSTIGVQLAFQRQADENLFSHTTFSQKLLARLHPAANNFAPTYGTTNY